jgi:diaminopimelate epimerase
VRGARRGPRAVAVRLDKRGPAVIVCAVARIRFHKYEGLGNDFIVVDLPAEGTGGVGPVQARRWCDRHVGIGADGVLALSPAADAAAAARRLTVWNADGTRAAMCGNGLRCVAAYLWSHGSAAERAATELRFETDSGVLACARAPGGLVRAQMAAPRVEARRAEIALPGTAAPVAPAGLPVSAVSAVPEAPAVPAVPATIEAVLVSVGNPHAVFFDTPVDPAALGAALQASARFPGGVNAEFARTAGPRRFAVAVWERGVGLTRACGTGATAVAAAAVATGRVTPGGPVAIDLPGGTLEVDVAPDLSTAAIVGPAVEVFSGEIAEPA